MNNYYRIICIVLSVIGFLMLGYGGLDDQNHERWVRIVGVVFTILSAFGLLVVNVLRPGRHNEDIL